MIDGAVPMANRKPLLSLLSEPDPLNLQAQVLLFQSESAEAASRVTLQKQFVGASSDALQTLLGFSTGQPAAPQPTPDWHCRVAEQLWGPPLIDFLDVQHRRLKAVADDPYTVALAATIPNGAMRVNLRRTLARHWSEGPQALRAAGVPATVLVEPGLLASLKSLCPGKPAGTMPRRRRLLRKPSNGHANAMPTAGRATHARDRRPSEIAARRRLGQAGGGDRCWIIAGVATSRALVRSVHKTGTPARLRHNAFRPGAVAAGQRGLHLVSRRLAGRTGRASAAVGP